MTAHVIQIFATTENPHPLSISQDNGATWTINEAADKTFSTLVSAGDTVQFKFDLKKNKVTNDISSIANITPASFYKPTEKPDADNHWTGTIKSGNPNNGVETYSIFYYVTDVKKKQQEDPKLTMTSSSR